MMDQETAQQLFAEGATLVFLDVPRGTEFGIDYNSWQVGDKFRGVKMIPPGIHFVYYSAVGMDRQVAPRTGFFHNFSAKEVLVKKWDAKTEDISRDVVSGEEQERIEQNKQQLDQHLGAYPYDNYKKWVSLTNHMTPRLLSRLHPACGSISAVPQLVSEPSDTASRKQAAAAAPSGDGAKVDKDGLPELKEVAGSKVNFSYLPKHTHPEGATPAEVTTHAMDRSFTLQALIADSYAGSAGEILGELQFSFICFMLGHLLDGFEHWKVLLRLVCECEAAISDLLPVYTSLIPLLHFHLKEVPEDMFVDIVSQDNFLRAVLQSLFDNMRDSGAPVVLKQRTEKFRLHLEKKFGWCFNIEEEDGEFAPVIVESVE